MQRFGIDTSRWQGDFNFAAAKMNEGVEFAIIKAGGADDGLYKDSQYENSYRKCVECKMDKGVYYFGNAKSIDDAKKEAAHILELIKGKKFEYPIFYDVEGEMLHVEKQLLTDIIKHVLSTVETAGYWVGLYGSSDNILYYADDTQLTEYSHWMAKYSKTAPKLSSGSELQMWQFGGRDNYIRSNQINRITVDQNYCYVDYPTLIKARGLNGFPKPSTPSISKEDNKVQPNTKIESNIITYTVKSGQGYWQIAEEVYGKAYVNEWYKKISTLNGNKDLQPGETIKIYTPNYIKDKEAGSTIKNGSEKIEPNVKVKIKQGATDIWTGKTYFDYVYKNVYTVISEKDGVVKFGINGTATGSTDINNIILV